MNDFMRDKESSTAWATLRKFLPYLWPRDDVSTRRRVGLAVGLLVLQKIATVGVGPIYSGLVDVVSAGDFILSFFIWTVAAYAIVRLLKQIFDELKYFVFARVAQQAIRAFALKTFRHLHGLSLRFHLDRQTGGLSRVIERGTKSIEFLLTFLLFNIAPIFLELFLVCAVLWWKVGGRFAAVIFTVVAVYALYTVFVTEWRIRFRKRMNEYDRLANTRAIDSLLNYETVKYFGAEEYEARRYDAALKKYEDAAVKNRTSLSLLNIGQGFIIAAGLTAVMLMAGHGIKNEGLTVGDFVLLEFYMIQLYLPLNFLGSVYREIRQALTDMDDMFALLEAPAEVVDIKNPADLKIGGGAVEFRNVRFGYGRGDILKDVSFKIDGGKKTAIVGASGAGKSTIAKLLFRFYDPQQGAILIDGQNIRDCAQESVRAKIGVVPQDTVLFNDTLHHNIRYGNNKADEKEIIQAAKSAAIGDFINALPEKYDTRVGERGLKLSGGEKQRVSIARALLKNPAVYIFDEATSALDSKTEKSIQRALNEISRSRTTLVIAHRLSTVVDADEIIVLSDGKIVEQGKHEELLNNKNHYAAMWQKQHSTADGRASANG